MAPWSQAARALGLAGLRAAKGSGAATAEGLQQTFAQQTRKMAAGGPIAFTHHSKGKPTPLELQGPEFITYAGMTISKPAKDFEHYWTKLIGGMMWFTMMYHFHINWEEHWYGDIWVFEKDVQMNGWGDEGHGDGDEGHGHATEAHH